MDLLSLGVVGALFTAAFIDAFFVTGLMFYGFMLIATAGVLYGTEQVTMTQIVLAAGLGTLLGNYVNFFVGYYGQHLPLVERVTCGKRCSQLRLKAEGLDGWRLLLLMMISRIVGFTRPLYGIALGALKLPPRRFLLFEFIVAVLWVAFWSSILYVTIESAEDIEQFLPYLPESFQP